MSDKRLLQELRKLSRTPASRANPQILQLAPTDESSLHHWSATIAKPTRSDSAYYYHGQWRLDIAVGEQYPVAPPRMRFSSQTPINHPNVNYATGEICLDILKSEAWSPAWNLEHLVGAVLMLMDDPEPDSPLNVDSANLYRTDKVAFEAVVQYTMWRHGTLHERARNPGGERD